MKHKGVELTTEYPYHNSSVGRPGTWNDDVHVKAILAQWRVRIPHSRARELTEHGVQNLYAAVGQRGGVQYTRPTFSWPWMPKPQGFWERRKRVILFFPRLLRRFEERKEARRNSLTERFLRVRDPEPGVDLLSRGGGHGLTPDLALSCLNNQWIVVRIEGGRSGQFLAASKAHRIFVRHVRVMSASVGRGAPAHIQLNKHR